MTDKETIIFNKAERILISNRYPPNRYKWGSYRMISPSQGHFWEFGTGTAPFTQ